MLRRTYSWLTCLSLAALAAGCATSGPEIRTDFAPDADFSAYSTLRAGYAGADRVVTQLFAHFPGRADAIENTRS